MEDKLDKTEPQLFQLDEDIQKLEVSLKPIINTYYENKSVHKFESKSLIEEDHTQAITIKLPKIPLPFFSGKFEEWSICETTFNELINNNPDLKDNEIIFYL